MAMGRVDIAKHQKINSLSFGVNMVLLNKKKKSIGSTKYAFQRPRAGRVFGDVKMEMVLASRSNAIGYFKFS